MIRKLAKNLLGKRQAYETVGQYYKRVAHVERKIKEYICITVLTIVVALGIAGMFVAWLTEDSGYYAPDCVVDGVLYDTDGDGDYHHWVEE